jgi:hypothetical protein
VSILLCAPSGSLMARVSLDSLRRRRPKTRPGRASRLSKARPLIRSCAQPRKIGGAASCFGSFGSESWARILIFVGRRAAASGRGLAGKCGIQNPHGGFG